MRGKVEKLRSEDDSYRFEQSIESRFATKRRLDLNDLLKRMKDQKKDDKKTNLLVLFGTAIVAVVVFLILIF